MSDTTLQAIHDAIAAHIADENDATEYLTEWILTAAAVVSNDAELTSYWFLHPKGTPYHHRLGLAHRGLELLVDP